METPNDEWLSVGAGIDSVLDPVMAVPAMITDPLDDFARQATDIL